MNAIDPGSDKPVKLVRKKGSPRFAASPPAYVGVLLLVVNVVWPAGLFLPLVGSHAYGRPLAAGVVVFIGIFALLVGVPVALLWPGLSKEQRTTAFIVNVCAFDAALIAPRLFAAVAGYSIEQ